MQQHKQCRMQLIKHVAEWNKMHCHSRIDSQLWQVYDSRERANDPADGDFSRDFRLRILPWFLNDRPVLAW